jgi:hypothetical protein
VELNLYILEPLNYLDFSLTDFRINRKQNRVFNIQRLVRRIISVIRSLIQPQAYILQILTERVLRLLTYLIRSSYTLWCRGFFSHFDYFTDGRTPWTSDKLVARPTGQHKHRINTHTHTKYPCLAPRSLKKKVTYGAIVELTLESSVLHGRL